LAGSVLGYINAREVPRLLSRLDEDRSGGAAGLVHDLDFGRKGLDRLTGVVVRGRSGMKKG
jgi:hypothetical protein